MEFDEVFEYINDFGVYQLVLFLLLGLTGFYSGWQNMGMSILASDMDHWCSIPRLQNYSYDQQRYIAIPWDEGEVGVYSRCEMWDLDYDSMTDQELQAWNRSDVPSATPLLACQSWLYDQSEWIQTAVNKMITSLTRIFLEVAFDVADFAQGHGSGTLQYDLVCEDSYLISLSSTIYLTGMLIGAPLSGVLSDKYGRKTILLIFSFMHLITATLAGFTPGYWSFTIIRFLLSLSAHIAFLCGFVIVMEITAPTYRTIMGTFFHGFFSLGYMMLPTYAYFVRDITYVQLCMALPVTVTLSYIFLVPESPRWLISKGKYAQARKVLQDLADVNQETLPDHIDFRPAAIETEVKGQDMVVKNDPDLDGKSSAEEATFLDLFKYPILRKEILIIYLGWFTNSLLYYGLGLNAGTLPGSIFLNVFIGGAIEIPAVFVCLLGMYYAGRRHTLCWGFVVAAIANFACIPVLNNEDLGWLLITFSMFGKACIKVSFIVIYAYTAELFPTPVRHIAVGSSSMMSRFGGLLAPFMGAPLMDVWAPLPSLIFGGMALISGILSFMLPETLNKDMPDTIAEAEELGRKKKKKESDTQVGDNVSKGNGHAPQDGHADKSHDHTLLNRSTNAAYNAVTNTPALTSQL